jgi:hypothetical protein
MAAALCMTWLLGNKVAEDKDRFTNYNIKTHVNQITTGVQNDRKKTEKTEGFYTLAFCSFISKTRGFLCVKNFMNKQEWYVMPPWNMFLTTITTTIIIIIIIIIIILD